MNGMTAAFEKLGHDTIDKLMSALREFREASGEVPGLIKIVVDSAFRRVPVRPEDRWLCGVTLFAKGEVSDRRFALLL